MRAPLLACVPGETTGAPHRRTLAEAGVPVFATPEEAVRAFFHLVRQRRARAAAAELPSRRVLDVAPDLDAAVRAVAAADGPALAAAYGIAPPPPGASIESRDDAVFGPAISVTLGTRTELELPPLNLALAQALLDRLGTALPLADTLVRLGQLVQDQPQLDSLFLDADGLRVTLRPPGQSARFAIPAFPADLAERFDARGLEVEIRPIRPEDAEAHAALFARLSPEDVRFRFFSMLRALSPEQIARMTQIDYDREMAFVAVRDGATLGVARLVLDPAIGAEFAVVVEPAAPGRGLARRLMQRLIDWGRAQGLDSITGQVLADNAPMLAFMRRMGAAIHRVPGDSEVVEAVIPL
jgi:acetyltransferase